MACSKPVGPITKLYTSCHPEQAKRKFLEKLFIENGIPCKILGINTQGNPSVIFLGVTLTVSFDDTEKSLEIQEEIRYSSGMRIFFDLETGKSAPYIVLKEWRARETQDAPSQKRPPPPLIQDDVAFPPVSTKSGNARQQQQFLQQQPQQQQQPPAQNPKLEVLQQLHMRRLNNLWMKHQFEIKQLERQFYQDVEELRQFEDFRRQKLSASSSGVVYLDSTPELSEELKKLPQESRLKTSYAEVSSAQEETPEEKELKFDEPETTSHFE